MKKKVIVSVSAAIVFICVLIGGWFTSLENKRKARISEPYMAINEEKITVAEHKYAYNLYMQEFLNEYGSNLNDIGLDISKSYKDQIQDQKSGRTWADFFETATQQKIIEINFMYKKAQEENYKYNDLSKAVNNIKSNFEINAQTKKMGLQDYLNETFVDGIKFEELKPILEKYEIAEQYISVYKKDIDITNEEIEEKYNNNKSNYDLVTYRVFSIPVSDAYGDILKEEGKDTSKISDNNTIVTNSEEFEKAKKQTKKEADDFYKQVYDEETYKQLCIKYSANNENKKTLYEENDYSLHSEENYETISSILAEWLYDEKREEKATAVIYDKDYLCYHIVYFIGRQKNDSSTLTVKNIFLPYITSDLETYQFTESDKAETKNIANEIVKEFNDSGRSEKDFDKLIEKYNKTVYTSSGNGVYKVSKKTDLPYTIREWCYDKNRKAGDISQFSDDAGCYVTYFIQNKDTGYNDKVRQDIETEKYHEYLNEKLNECKIRIYK